MRRIPRIAREKTRLRSSRIWKVIPLTSGFDWLRERRTAIVVALDPIVVIDVT